MKKTMVELFAGVGGFRYALEDLGWKTVWANQWEPSTKIQHAFEVYVANFGKENAVNEDINTVDKSIIPDHTLLVGGFPCQDYSVARTKAQGIQGKKGVLWWSIEDTLKVKKPQYFLLENVDRLIKSPADQRGRDFGVMLRSVHDLGYNLEWRVINAAEYGFAQKRRRVFIFGYHKTSPYYKKTKNIDKKELLTSKGFFTDQFPVDKNFITKKKEISGTLTKGKYKDLVSVSDNFQALFNNSGILVDGKFLSIDTKPIEIDPIPLKNILESNVDDSFYIDKDKNKLKRFTHMKSSKREKRIDKNGYEYYYSEGGMSFPDNLDSPARTVLTSESSVNRSTHVIKDPITKRLRLLTPVEVERINGFPENWTSPNNVTIPISKKKRYFFMGNALVVDVVKQIGKTLNKIINEQ